MNNIVTLKSKAWVRFPIRFPLTMAVSLTVYEIFSVKE